MEIILKKDVLNLGYANDVVTVKDGYAQNYLIPQGYAVMATASAKKINAENQKQKAFKEQKIRKDAEAMVSKLENLTVKIGAKAATTGKIYGSVNNIQVADALKEQHNIEIDRKKIVVDGEAIKEVGNYTAQVNLYKDVKTAISLEVFAE